MADFNKKLQTDNNHLSNLTTARFIHVDGGSGTARAGAGRLLRVILNTNGATVTLKDGASRVVGIIAADAPEGTYNYGVYCENGIQYETGGNVDATIVFDD